MPLTQLWATITILAVIICSYSQCDILLPTSTTGQVIHHTYYCLSYNEDHEQAEWTYHVLTSEMLNGSTSRTDNFREDPKVTTGSAALADYKGSGYDRGHLVPAGDMTFSHTAMSESFYISNMSPQNPSFNRGIWKKLENHVRELAAREGKIHIVSGPILGTTMGSIGPNSVTIPAKYYKVILDYQEPDLKAIAFILPNSKGTLVLNDYAVSVDRVEQETGIDFFPALPDNVESLLESSVNTFLLVWGVSSSSSSSTSSKTSTSSQCMGIAKSTGVRSRNKTTNENGYCHVHQSQAPGYEAPTTTDYVGRCQAITQAGTQCKRNAEAGSKYCWQHK